MSTAVGGFAVFGKVPARADFLRAGGSSQALAQFDDWLSNSVEWAHARSGAEWCNAFRVGSAHAFMFRVIDRDVSAPSYIVGALAPSRDQAGRLFPISVSAPVALGPDFTGEPQLLPFACESIWQSAGECVAELSSNPNADSASHVGALQVPMALSFADARDAYTGWSQALPVAELWQLIFGSPAPDPFRSALQLLSAAVEPFRNRETPNTRLSLRLPLGVAGGAAVCFWLDVVRRLARWQATVPSFFWSHDGAAGQLTVHLGSPPAATISELWLPTARFDEFCDLTVALDPALLQALPALPGAAERALLLAGPVATFLAALSN
jgi:type VI secretion system ImpM family protein